MNIRLIISVLFVNTILFAILFIGLGNEDATNNKDLFLFAKTSPRNLNQNNWANHDYPYNMLNTAEPNSIFMTEGGDNQVFSILYFALVEERRLDMDFFDQKGNVFPRLYGDFFKSTAADVQMIRSIRDFQLFSTGRPVYLTWQRPGLENISLEGIQRLKADILEQLPVSQRGRFDSSYRVSTIEELEQTAERMVPSSIYNLDLRSGGSLKDQDFQYLGPWYYKTQGLLYRVTPMRYAIVDILEIFDSPLSSFVLRRNLFEYTGYEASNGEFGEFLFELAEEGYIEINGGNVQLKRPFYPFAGMTDEGYWEEYTMSHQTVPNASHWERLARDIFVSYAYLQRDLHIRSANAALARSRSLQVTQTGEELLASLQQIGNENVDQARIEEMDAEQQAAINILLETAPYAYDNNGFMYDVGNILRENNRGLEAVDYYEQAADNSYPLIQPLFLAIEILLREAYFNADERETILARALKNADEAISHRELGLQLKDPHLDPKEDPIVQQALKFRKQIETLGSLSPEDLRSRREALLASNPIGEMRTEIQALVREYLSIGRVDEVIEIYERLLLIDETNPAWYLDFITFVAPENPEVALTVLDNFEAKYALFAVAPPLWQLDYTRGILIFRQQFSFYRAGTPIYDLASRFTESKERLESYVSLAQGIAANNETIRQRVIQAEKTVEYINRLLPSNLQTTATPSPTLRAPSFQ